jgi:hypothetical protein
VLTACAELDSTCRSRETLKDGKARGPDESGPVKGENLRRLLFLVIMFGVSSLAQDLDFGGPSILSRGSGTVLQGGGELMLLKPYFSLSGVYDTALTPASVTASGEIPKEDGYGGELNFGVNGYRRWRHTLLGVSYRGGVRKYANSSYYDGSDHTLILGVTHQPYRRLAFTLRQAAGTHSRNYSFFGGQEFFDPAFAQVPSNELFDSRTNFLSSMADMTFKKSSRLSFNLGGTRMLVRRRSSALIGVDGWTTRGDVAYYVARRVMVGADYNFTHYTFTKAFGASDIHGAAVDFSFQLGRNWDLSLRAGGARIETLGLKRVDVDPVIAAIIGRTTGIEAFYAVQYLPSFQGSLSRVFRRSSLSFSYDDAPTAGNGIYLLSRGRNAGASFSYTSFQRLNFGISAGYSTYRSLSQSLGRYESYNAGAGVNCRLKRWLHLTTRYDVRTFDIGGGLLHRFSQRGTVGLAVSPGETPLALW